MLTLTSIGLPRVLVSNVMLTRTTIATEGNSQQRYVIADNDWPTEGSSEKRRCSNVLVTLGRTGLHGKQSILSFNIHKDWPTLEAVNIVV